ncbi:MAG: serine hydrolase [Bacteroidia bacterium]|nr:serine hydrolase [Bacteroidia bacterium]
MKTGRNILKWIVIVLAVINLGILVSGKTYLYKGIANTYFKGRSGPDIDEYKIFSNREIKTAHYQPIPNAKDYNLKNIDTKAFEPYGTVAYLIIKNDSVCYEQYWEGYTQNSFSNSFSMAKSFVGILVGCALQDGYIKTLDDAVGDFLPEFKIGDNSKLTIRHLLTMSSGINFDEDYVNPFAYPAAAYYGTNIKKLTLQYKVTEDPGKQFKYLSGNTELLGMILEKATGKKLSEYMSERLWQPMGAKNAAYWSLDHDGGMEKAYCCFNSNARDFSRFGLLYLHNGKWNNNQLVPADYVKQATEPAPLLDESGKTNTSYGYQWWIVDYKGHHMPYCRGILGQYIITIPDKNMVVVRLGHKRDKEKQNDHPKDLFIYIDKALEAY